MITNIGVQNVNSLIERGIIATFSFFVDYQFTIVLNENDFVVNLQPTIPLNWRNAIDTRVVNGVERNTAQYFVRRKNQTFYLDFSSNSRTDEVHRRIIDCKLMKVSKLVYEGKYFILNSFSAFSKSSVFSC